MTLREEALRLLAREAFDVVVVGAGIHGSSAAWTAARLGLKTALIDAGDFGAETSANSLKIIHGGLRYLQHGNLRRMRESIRARRRFLALAPELVRPQAFAIPTRGYGIRGRTALRVALALNDLIAFDRNIGVPGSHRIPGGRILSREEAERIWPQIPRDAYDGAAVWYDALAHDIERLTLAFALTARREGAVIANYVRAERLLEANGSVSGVRARDLLAGEEFEIRARAVLNAAGPWWQTWHAVGQGHRHPLVGAWNVIVRKRWFGDFGVGLESRREHVDAEALIQRGTRNLFFVPWREGTMIGTVYEPYSGDPSAYRPTLESVESFLAEINAVLPGANLSLADVRLLHVGVQPASTAGGSPEPDKHSELLEGPIRGLVHIKGVKYTTGLTVGESAAKRIAIHLGRKDRLAGREELIRASPLRGSIAEQVRQAVSEEFAVRLADVVVRRTGLGTFEQPPVTAVDSVAAELARILGWSTGRLAKEKEDLADHYRRFLP